MEITPGTSMGRILDRFPDTVRVLAWHGVLFRAAHRDQTVEAFAEAEDVDLEDLMVELRSMTGADDAT